MNILKKLLNLIFDLLSYPWFLGNITYKLDKQEWYFKLSDEDIKPSFSHLLFKYGQ